MPREKSHITPQSKMEAVFVASSTLRRNKRYFDIEKINGIQNESHVRRRKPYSSSKSIVQKINRSFSNSTAAFTQRLQNDINKCRGRFNSEERPLTAEKRSVSRGSSRSSKQIKGVGIGQHLSRQQFYKTKSKPVLDQRLFNNYHLDAPDHQHAPDLGRGPVRDFDNSIKTFNDIQFDSQKLYEDFYYKRTTMDCRFHYKKQRQDERQYYTTKRPENKAATDLSPKAVKASEQFAEPRRGPIDSFYMNSGRQLPCNLQNRTGTALTSHWRNRSGLIQRPNIEYSVRSYKQKLQSERKDKIVSSKKPVFNRQEICDKKYFIINAHI